MGGIELVSWPATHTPPIGGAGWESGAVGGYCVGDIESIDEGGVIHYPVWLGHRAVIWNNGYSSNHQAIQQVMESSWRRRHAD